MRHLATAAFVVTVWVFVVVASHRVSRVVDPVASDLAARQSLLMDAMRQATLTGGAK